MHSFKIVVSINCIVNVLCFHCLCFILLALLHYSNVRCCDFVCFVRFHVFLFISMLHLFSKNLFSNFVFRVLRIYCALTSVVQHSSHVPCFQFVFMLFVACFRVSWFQLVLMVFIFLKNMFNCLFSNKRWRRYLNMCWQLFIHVPTKWWCWWWRWWW